MRIYDVLKKPFFGRYQQPWRWPAGVDQTSWRRVWFSNASGARLAGLFGEATTGSAKASIVCAHPMGTEAKGFFLKQGHSAMLRDSGYNVLLFDFNGFGESKSGDFRYPEDIRAAGRMLQELAPGLPLGALGLSFGAAWLICALAEEGHGFKAAVTECPFTTLEEYWRRYPIAYASLRTINLVMPKLASELRPIDRIRHLHGVDSILMVYGEQDTVTPPSMGERLAAACGLPAEQSTLWVAPQGKHTKVMAAVPDVYRERVVSFLDRSFCPR